MSFMYFCSLCGGPFCSIYLQWDSDCSNYFDARALPLREASADWLDSVHVLTERNLTGSGYMSEERYGVDGGYFYFADETDGYGPVEPHGAYGYTNSDRRDRRFYRGASFAVHAACWALLQRVLPRDATRRDVYGALGAAWGAVPREGTVPREGAVPREWEWYEKKDLQWLPLAHSYFGASRLWRHDGVNCEEGWEWLLADPLAAVAAVAAVAGAEAGAGGATTGVRCGGASLPAELWLEVAERFDTVDEVEAVVGRGGVPPGFWRRRGCALGVLWELDQAPGVDWRRVLRTVEAHGTEVQGGLTDVTARNRIRIWSVCRLLVHGENGVKAQMARRLAREERVAGLETPWND
ncbi:hypothetical protein EDC01DRAFT_776484 [Geopyxis carbonaria]|nr:hypothetical protein EDC01DRAFT_776484 [Geopyxis carbonaria]